jgi:hypothetical protein
MDAVAALDHVVLAALDLAGALKHHYGNFK